MNKILLILALILSMNTFISQECFSFSFFKQKTNSTEIEKDLEPVNLTVEEDEKLKIEKNEPITTLDDKPFAEIEEEQLKAFEIQRKQDVEDVTNLWNATLERNNIIKFALKKVVMNPEERKKHSSKMIKTVSALVNGASLLPYVFGMNSALSSATAAGTSMITQVIKNKMGAGMDTIPITDTELIQLASLIETLQDGIIRNYYDYKSSIEALKDCRAKSNVYKKNLKQAQFRRNQTAILVAQTMLEKQQMEELTLKNRIKMARIQLERFAGEEVVNNLNLTKVQEIKTETKVNNATL